MMYRLCNAVILFLIFEILYNSSGYKWIHVKPGNRIPADAQKLSYGLKTYVGRARHYDEVLPAEVYNSTYALIYTCSEVIMKTQFEILVDTEFCNWKRFKEITEVPEQVVRVGNQWNGEPNYLAYAVEYQYARIASILLTSKQLLKWKGTTKDQHGLVCDDNNNWFDSSSEKIPKNTVSGGKAHDGNDIYVARLKKGCDIVPGQVIPDLGIATAVHHGIYIESAFSQVLVGDNHNYSWVFANNGEIPDYAVFSGKSKSNELMYVARVNKTLGYILHSDALQNKRSYEVLVKDEE